MARKYATPTNTGSVATAGKDYLIYLNTGETEATPVWTLLGGQRSGDLARKADSIDASNKTSGGWKSSLAGLREWSIDLESVVILNDAGSQFWKMPSMMVSWSTLSLNIRIRNIVPDGRLLRISACRRNTMMLPQLKAHCPAMVRCLN